MAGIGSRFQKAGYKEPKPLILIDNKPMIAHVISMFPPESDFLFICNEIHLKETMMSDIIKSYAPNAKIVGIPTHKLGPVHSIIQAKEYIKTNEPVVVSYCDISVVWNYQNFLVEMTNDNVDSGFVAFKGFHPPLIQDGFYATTRIDENRNLIEVREKFSFTPNKIDSWTSAGIHYFRTGALLRKYFNKLIDRKILCGGEYFVSLVHNLLIEDGLKNKLYPVDYFISWGKPEDIREYLYWSRHFNQTK